MCRLVPLSNQEACFLARARGLKLMLSVMVHTHTCAASFPRSVIASCFSCLAPSHSLFPHQLNCICCLPQGVFINVLGEEL